MVCLNIAFLLYCDHAHEIIRGRGAITFGLPFLNIEVAAQRQQSITAQLPVVLHEQTRGKAMGPQQSSSPSHVSSLLLNEDQKSEHLNFIGSHTIPQKKSFQHWLQQFQFALSSFSQCIITSVPRHDESRMLSSKGLSCTKETFNLHVEVNRAPATPASVLRFPSIGITRYRGTDTNLRGQHLEWNRDQIQPNVHHHPGAPNPLDLPAKHTHYRCDPSSSKSILNQPCRIGQRLHLGIKSSGIGARPS